PICKTFAHFNIGAASVIVPESSVTIPVQKYMALIQKSIMLPQPFLPHSAHAAFRPGIKHASSGRTDK
ncbi:MAG: hypothetical protein ACYC9O_14085, partial [Candidatus Latescibacterota bacterium]